nr:hypothetical protein [Tanacetum cinerariifolium]
MERIGADLKMEVLYLDTYGSGCDDISNEKVVLMANISNYGPDVISEVPHSETYLNDMENQKAPKELSKASLVDESLKNLKLHLENFDKVVKIRTTPNARRKGEWGFKHSKAVFSNESIPFLKSLKYIFNVFDRDLLNEIMEVQTLFDQMDVAVQQSSVDKQRLEIGKKKLFLEKDRLLHQIMSQDVLLSVMNSMSLIDESVNVERKQNESCDKCFNFEAELLKSQNAHNDLLKRKRKEIVDITIQKPSANTIVPGMFKLELEPLALRLLQNREIHIEYLKYTQEQAGILWGIIKQAKAKHPLDNALDFAYKHDQRIQELLVYVQNTCPNAINLTAKKVAVTPKNKVKKVRFVEPLTSLSNIKQVESSKTPDSNILVLSPT